MPRLSTIADVEELDNLYADKCIVYVEGDEDQKVWERIVGTDLADRLEFKVPLQAGSGSDVVWRRVRDERPKNPKIFGLLDGEAAAVFGQIENLVNCAEPIFVINGSAYEGILFIAGHELENILIGYSDLTTFAIHNVALRELGQRDAIEVHKQLISFARRFFIAALFKYTSAHMRAEGIGSEIVDVDRFLSEESILDVIRAMKSVVKTKGEIPPEAFMKQLLKIARLLKTRVERERMTRELKDGHLIRLADGKGLMKTIKRRWRMPSTAEGHLLDRVRQSPFAREFRQQLIALTISVVEPQHTGTA